MVLFERKEGITARLWGSAHVRAWISPFYSGWRTPFTVAARDTVYPFETRQSRSAHRRRNSDHLCFDTVFHEATSLTDQVREVVL